MKIGIDIRSLMDSQFSGVSEYTLNTLTEIINIDSKNQFFLFYNSFGDKEAIVSEDIKSRANVKIIKTDYPNKLFNYVFQKIFTWPQIDKLCGGLDVFWSPHINFTSLSKNTKSLITIHDLSFFRYPEFFSFRKNIWHNLLGVKKMLQGYDQIIAVSENTKKDIVEICGVNENKITVVYSGIDPVCKKIDSEIHGSQFREVVSRYNLPDKYILYLGTIEPRKNIRGIIKAYNIFRDKHQDYKNYKLVLVGAKGWKSEDIYKEREVSKYRDDINFVGYIDKKHKSFIYSLASLFIYPSFYEGFGFPPLEAMACGVPVIVSACSSLPEILEEGALKVDPYNVNALENAIYSCLSNKSLQERLVQKGKIVSQKYNWQNTSREYLKIISEL